MRILLVQSFSGPMVNPVFPIGLSYIAGVLDKHEVEGFDPNVEGDYINKLKEKIVEFNPDLVGISIRNIWPFSDGKGEGLYYKDAILPLLRVIKSAADVPVVAGGSGFTTYAKEIMEDLEEIDCGVFRDGEETFPQLLENLSNPENVKGVYYRKDGHLCFGGAREMREIDNLPGPKREIFDMDNYKEYSGSMGVQTKRGCALRCSYCVYPHICGDRMAMRSTVKVVDEIEHLSNTYGIRNIVFVDTVFNVPMDNAVEICRELIERDLGIRWTAFFNPKNMTEEFMKLAVESGCYLFEYSPDAYSNKMLRLLNKNITTDDILNTCELARRIEGANVSYNFFVNGPGENIFTFMRLLLFSLRARMSLKGKLKRFFFSHLHIEPNTALCRLALENGMIDQNAEFLGSKEVYEKMIYNNSMAVNRIFYSIVKIKSVIKSVLNAGSRQN